MTMSMTKYLKPITSRVVRQRIREGAFRKGFRMGKIGTDNKMALAEAVFEVEDEFESRGDGQPRHPLVVAMRGVRNRLYDDLGWNEKRGEGAEAGASAVAQGRRRRGSGEQLGKDTPSMDARLKSRPRK